MRTRETQEETLRRADGKELPGVCLACKGGILWGRINRDLRIPLDEEPAIKGQVLLHPHKDQAWWLLDPEQREVLRAYSVPLYTPHLQCSEGEPWWRKAS